MVVSIAHRWLFIFNVITNLKKFDLIGQTKLMISDRPMITADIFIKSNWWKDAFCHVGRHISLDGSYFHISCVYNAIGWSSECVCIYYTGCCVWVVQCLLGQSRYMPKIAFCFMCMCHAFDVHWQVKPDSLSSGGRNFVIRWQKFCMFEPLLRNNNYFGFIAFNNMITRQEVKDLGLSQRFAVWMQPTLEDTLIQSANPKRQVSPQVMLPPCGHPPPAKTIMLHPCPLSNREKHSNSSEVHLFLT